MPQSPKSTISRRLAAQHEGVYLRLVALTRQAEALGQRRPELGVPEPVLVLAEAALFDARVFHQPRPSARFLPAAAPHYGALAAQLASALAELVAFEARHSGWDDSLKAFLWRVAGPPLPIGRLRPKLDSKTYAANRQESRDLRDKLARHIQALKRSHEPDEPKARAYPPRPTPPAPSLPRVR